MSPIRVMQFSIVAAVFIGIVSCKSPNKNSESSALALSGNRTSGGGTSGPDTYNLSCSTIGLRSRPDPREVTHAFGIRGRSVVEGTVEAVLGGEENDILRFRKVDLDVKLFDGFRSTTPIGQFRFQLSIATNVDFAYYSIDDQDLVLQLVRDSTVMGILRESRSSRRYGYIAIPPRGPKYALQCDPLAPNP